MLLFARKHNHEVDSMVSALQPYILCPTIHLRIGAIIIIIIVVVVVVVVNAGVTLLLLPLLLLLCAQRVDMENPYNYGMA